MRAGSPGITERLDAKSGETAPGEQCLSSLYVDRLIADTVGLLFDSLALDDVLTGADLLGLAERISPLAAITSQDEKELAAALVAAATRMQAVFDVRGQLSAAAIRQSVVHSAEDVTSALTVLRYGGDADTLRALSGIPAEAFAITRADLRQTVGNIKVQLRPYVAARERYPPEALAGAMELDLPNEIKHLRNRGWLFGLIQREADAALDRVRPHLRPSSRQLSAAAAADILVQVLAVKECRARLDAHLAAQPRWAQWLRKGRQGVRSDRLAALDWALINRDRGCFVERHAALLGASGWRRVLSDSAVQEAARRAFRSEHAELDSPGTSAVRRLEGGRVLPDDCSPDTVDGWHSQIVAHSHLLARAIHVIELAAADPPLRAAVDAALKEAPTSLGPIDPTRARLRRIQQRVLDNLSTPADRSPSQDVRHPLNAELRREVDALEREIRETLATRARVRGPLQVAIAGRTKTGKTTLRKVLTRDPTLHGIGQGAHRTTRQTSSFTWRGLEFLDTPGVAAFEDDFDADIAQRSCLAADAVLWVYADALRTEEADILQMLLAMGKPVLMVYNAKRRVDSAERLKLFCEHPHLAFRHTEGHIARVAQIAAEVGARPPVVIAAQVGAGRESLTAADRGLAELAWHASRLPDVEEGLRRLLIEQAQALRAVRLADAVFQPLLLAEALVHDAGVDLVRRVDGLPARLGREEAEFGSAVSAADAVARRVLRKQFARLRRQVDDFVGGVTGDDPNGAWQALLMAEDMTAPMTAFGERLAADADRVGLLLDAEERADERMGDRTGLKAKPRTQWWRRVRAAVMGSARRLVGQVLGRKAAARGAAKKALPVVGWLLVVADVLAGAARAVNDDVAASELEMQAWRRDAASTVRAELGRLKTRLAERLAEKTSRVRQVASEHFRDAHADVRWLTERLAAISQMQATSPAAREEVDLVLVQRLLDLAGLDGSSVHRARRTPNDRLEVWCDATAPLASITDRLESVVVRALRLEVVVYPIQSTRAVA